MPSISIEISQQDLTDVVNMLSGIKDGAATAIYRSVNKGLSHAKTQAVKAIGQELTLKAARIKKDFSMRKASKSVLSGAVWATGQPVGLLNFSANKVKAGYSVKVKKRSSRTLLKHAFKAKTRKLRNDGSEYETEHLWWRSYDGPRSGTGTENVGYFAGLPAGHPMKGPELERLTGPRIEDIFGQDDILSDVQDKASAKITENLGKETYNLLRRFG
jgi:hypothetical protein